MAPASSSGAAAAAAIAATLTGMFARHKCPSCEIDLPPFRRPKDFDQLLWGGWTCASCGAEVTRDGRLVPGKEK